MKYPHCCGLDKRWAAKHKGLHTWMKTGVYAHDRWKLCFSGTSKETFTEAFEVVMLTALVILSKVLVTSPVRTWVTWEFHQTSTAVQTAVYPRKELCHEWSAEMMSSSHRLITSPQAWTCNESSVPGGKHQLQGNLRVSISIWQSGFSSQWLQVKKKGERMEI